MENKIDCRKKENKGLWKCKVNKFCKKRESNFTLAGKGIISLASPTTGIAITAYETGKSLIKLSICKR